MQSLDATVHHLGKTRYVRNVGNSDPGITKRFRGAAGRDYLHAESGEGLCEFDRAGFV
jgi:hypothetical protein